jgi:hypothetical protein
MLERIATCTALLSVVACQPAVAAEIITDGSFVGSKSSSQLRKDEKGQDWYESRKDGKEGRALLILSTKTIGGNATPKAMLKGDLKRNTYLSQRFPSPQSNDFTIEFDIYVREILPKDNRSAFILVGTSTDGKNGPNSTANERFVFLAFENAATKGKINIFARERAKDWAQKTLVASNLDLGAWHRIALTVQPKKEHYQVSVKGGTPRDLEAFAAKGKTPKELTHLSFASWNDGAGTFYVDNVTARTK